MLRTLTSRVKTYAKLRQSMVKIPQIAGQFRSRLIDERDNISELLRAPVFRDEMAPITNSVVDRVNAPVEYLPLVENKDFHIGVFILQPGARLPLHDHPSMDVFMRVCSGGIRLDSYQWIKEPSSSSPLIRDARWLGTETLDDDLHNFKFIEDLVHSVEALTPAVFVDIQTPPYDPEQDRICRFYRRLSAAPPQQIHSLVTLRETPESDADV